MRGLSRGQLAVGSVLVLLAAPIAAEAVARVVAGWSGEPFAAVPLIAGALGPAAIAGAAAVARGRPSPLVGWLAAGLAGAVLAATTGAPVTAVCVAAAVGWLAAHGLAWAAARAPVPRGRAAILWGVLAAVGVLQVGRMSAFMADPTLRWGALVPEGFATRHSCLSSYVHGAELARRGDANIYDDRYGNADSAAAPELPSVIDVGPLTMDTYEYPPAFLPLPRLMLAVSRDFMVIRALWFALTAAVFAACAVGLARWLGGETGRRAGLLTLLVALSPHLLMTAYFGNFQLAAMGLSALAMVWIWRGRTRSGAAILAFTVGAKIFPGILIIYLLTARRFAAVAWTAVFGAGYALLALAVFGSRPYLDFFNYHLPRLASGETFAFLAEEGSIPFNLAVFGLPFKLRALGWAGSEADAWALAARLSWVYTAVVVAIAAAAGLRARAAGSETERARLGGLWFGLLALAALRSPFSPPAALIPVFWGLSLRAATVHGRRAVVGVVLLWVALHVIVPGPSTPAMAATMVTQALLYATAIGLALARTGPRA